MTPTQLDKRLLLALKNLLKDVNGEFSNTNPNYGICPNLYRIGLRSSEAKRVITRFKEIAKGWPLHSGDYNYPIPSDDPSFTSKEKYENTRKHWTNKNGELRKDLLMYCIYTLEHMK